MRILVMFVFLLGAAAALGGCVEPAAPTPDREVAVAGPREAPPRAPVSAEPRRDAEANDEARQTASQAEANRTEERLAGSTARPTGWYAEPDVVEASRGKHSGESNAAGGGGENWGAGVGGHEGGGSGSGGGGSEWTTGESPRSATPAPRGLAPTAPPPPHHALAGGGLAAPVPTLPNVISVLYGTDRARSDATPIGYNGERGSRLELGEVEVSVPKSHVRGKVERPSLISVEIKEDPAKHFVISRAPAVLSEAQFVQLAHARDQGRSALLFVHGFNQSFDDGLYRTAQLAYDLQINGPVFYYSWPSRKEWFLYSYDTASAEQAEPYFETFLRLIMQKAGVTRLNIIAHSHGNVLVLKTLKTMAIEPDGLSPICCGQLILASPDVDTTLADELIPLIAPHFRGVTLYANNHDRALGFSGWWWGNEPRLGELQKNGWPALLSGMDSIDATAAPFSIFDLNHDVYVDNSVLLKDINMILGGLEPPDARSPQLVLVHVPPAPGQFWRFVPQ